MIRPLLFGVTPLSPVVFLMVAVMFVVVAALACLVPALRATRIDPLRPFRAQ